MQRPPLSGVRVIADARNYLPGIAGVATAEQRGRFHAAQEFLAVLARLERPDVGESASVVLGKGRG